MIAGKKYDQKPSSYDNLTCLGAFGSVLSGTVVILEIGRWEGVGENEQEIMETIKIDKWN